MSPLCHRQSGLGVPCRKLMNQQKYRIGVLTDKPRRKYTLHMTFSSSCEYTTTPQQCLTPSANGITLRISHEAATLISQQIVCLSYFHVALLK